MSVQLITSDQRKTGRFTPQQKVQVLKEWERTGNGVEVAQKYQIHAGVLCIGGRRPWSKVHRYF